MILPQSYYQHDDVLYLSRDLLGKFLMTKINGIVTGGMIVETEAYRGPEDRASHAHGGRRTKRTETMYQAGGVCYVYCCYGIHSLFNIVTNIADIPHAILIRAIHPQIGIDTILKRRSKPKLNRAVTGGPGALSQGLGIDTSHDGFPLTKDRIWVEDRKVSFTKKQVLASPRVGVAYAGEDAQLPWRFRIKDSEWTSAAK